MLRKIAKANGNDAFGVLSSNITYVGVMGITYVGIAYEGAMQALQTCRAS